jgi:hypothetical protein
VFHPLDHQSDVLVRESTPRGGIAFTEQAAAVYDRGQRSEMEAGLAKLAAMENAAKAMRIHGAYGYSPEYNIERYHRDAPLLCIGGGTNELQRFGWSRTLEAKGSYKVLECEGFPTSSGPSTIATRSVRACSTRGRRARAEGSAKKGRGSSRGSVPLAGIRAPSARDRAEIATGSRGSRRWSVDARAGIPTPESCAPPHAAAVSR